MATKKTDKSAKTAKTAKTTKKAPAKKAASKSKEPKVAKAAKAPSEPKVVAPRHPKARLAALHGSKESLAKSLAESIARDDEDTGIIANRLEKASNMQLLRLQQVVTTVKEKYGSREKLIAAIGTADKKGSDKDYLAKLDSLSLPNLLELARSHERRARA